MITVGFPTEETFDNCGVLTEETFDSCGKMTKDSFTGWNGSREGEGCVEQKNTSIRGGKKT